MTFLNRLSVDELENHEWRLSNYLRYEGKWDEFVVPLGFVTDFASVPRLLWSFFPPYGRYTKAAVLHDYLYITQKVSRKDADGIFRRTMRELGVGRVRRWLMWAAVRMFGRYHKTNLSQHTLP